MHDLPDDTDEPSSQETTADSPTVALPLPKVPVTEADEDTGPASSHDDSGEPAGSGTSSTLPEDAEVGDADGATTPLPDEVSAEVEAMVGDEPDAAEPDVALVEEEHEESDETPSARERAAEVCQTLIELYEGLERRLRESGTQAIGWGPQLAALRAMRDGHVPGDRDELARLLVAAEAEDVIWDVPVGETVEEVLGAGERALVLAPTEARAEEIARTADDEVLALLVTAGSEQPLVQEEPPAVPEPESVPGSLPYGERPSGAGRPGAGAPVREDGANRTVEFRPLTSVDLTRPQEIPQAEAGAAEEGTGPTTPPPPKTDERAPEARVRTVVVRPIGEAWQKSWAAEARMLQRGLMWLEQWPRDLAALDALKTAKGQRKRELDAELAGLAARIEEIRAAVEAAEQAGTRATAEVERLEAVRAEIAAELEGPRAEAQRLQMDADAKAEEAGRLTRTAEATLARCNALEQRNEQARAELQAAQQEEESLTADLARARDELPRAAETADRLLSESAAADAEGHTRYYRLAAAESSLAAQRRKRSLGQRLHVAATPPELKELRAEVKALTREADGAAKRAAQAKEAADRAQTYRTQLETFLREGGARLTVVQESQRQLAAELSRLAKERTAATADHQDKAQRAAEAVNRAAQASTLAVSAQRVAQEIEGRLAVAHRENESAKAALDHARAEVEAAGARLAETQALLSRRRAEAEEELAARGNEFDTALAAEARSRANVEEICGGGPIGRDLLATHQQRAMARIEELTTQLNRAEDGFGATATTGEGQGDDTGDVLLRTAGLVCGTPLTVGATAQGTGFDTLVVAGAGALNEADFLVGAVRARRWVLLGFPDESPPAHSGYEGHTGAERLTRSPFEFTAPAS